MGQDGWIPLVGGSETCVHFVAACNAWPSTTHTWMHRWPAMMEEDPDREAYYEMGEHRNVPVWAVIIKLTLYTVNKEQKDVAACVMLPK